MTLKRILSVAIIAVLLFVGVKFAMVYVNYLQVKSLMSSEALDARRTEAAEGDIEANIRSRAAVSSATLPEDVEYSFEGVGEPEEDLVVHASYTDVVDLIVVQVPMKMNVTAVAEPPID
ncbi:MAG: hypothetical protein KC620_08350 [Myxococcales bacterium]|nr:hypothetical protein [Myxococcales bacterium]